MTVRTGEKAKDTALEDQDGKGDPSFGFQWKKSIAVFPSAPSKKAWAKELGIKDTKLLSDFWPHGEAARSYGIFREKEGFSERANIIVDEKGQVFFVKVYPISQLPDIEEIIRALEG